MSLMSHLKGTIFPPLHNLQ